MNSEAIQELIEQGIPNCEARVDGDGTHFQAIVVSDAFEGLGMVKQHQLVYQALGERMKGDIHALTLRTYTPEEWSRASKLQTL